MLERGEVSLGKKQTPLDLRFPGLRWCRHAVCFSKRRLLPGAHPRKPRGPCYKVVLRPRPFPPTFSSPPRPCGISHLLLTSLIFSFPLSSSTWPTIALVVQILKQQQNLPMNLFPSKLRSHFRPVTAPLLLALLPHLLFIPRPSAAQILPHLGQRTHEGPNQLIQTLPLGFTSS